MQRLRLFSFISTINSHQMRPTGFAGRVAPLLLAVLFIPGSAFARETLQDAPVDLDAATAAIIAQQAPDET